LEIKITRRDYSVRWTNDAGDEEARGGRRIVLILRDGREPAGDNGVWLATSAEHHESPRLEFPNMRRAELFGMPGRDTPDFEEAALTGV